MAIKLAYFVMTPKFVGEYPSDMRTLHKAIADGDGIEEGHFQLNSVVLTQGEAIRMMNRLSREQPSVAHIAIPFKSDGSFVGVGSLLWDPYAGRLLQ